ncbi:MAG: SUMF1/EgtB/PvdO family nonheme iron enzyme [Labilithrix sp.]|nr:SUMF1/EgtB/PvdO family nonheme iron enzyme [Labilithrix sp.]MCW5811670.1 SUMF1/EgtB/PvdO family nonheme iron enzyme [Labilithrix sp.]
MLRLRCAAPLIAAFFLASACGSDTTTTADPNAAGPNFPPTEGKGGTVIDLSGDSRRGKSRSCAKSNPGTDNKCGGVAGDDKALGNTDCCETRVVQGGSYNRFNNPKFPATVSTFQLDTFLVTAGRFRAWVDEMKGNLRSSSPPAGAGAHPKIPNSGWRTEWNRFLPTSRAEVDRMFSREDSVEGNLACQFGTNIYEQGALTWWTAQLEKEIKDTTEDEDVRAENTKEALDRKPINCIPWQVLFAFCIWDGGRLPTDAEFGYAAAGGSEQRRFPWGNMEDGDLAPIGDLQNVSFVPTFTAGKKYMAARLWDTRIGNGKNVFEDNYGLTWGANTFDEVLGNAQHIMPVGRRPDGAGKWGQLDLAGNMFEWMLDEGPIQPGTCKDCANVDFPKPTEFDPKVDMDPERKPDFHNKTAGGVSWWRGGARSIRGGAWDNAYMLSNSPTEGEIDYYTAYPLLRTYRSLGGRCARNPD